jgi:hypothetical protein
MRDEKSRRDRDPKDVRCGGRSGNIYENKGSTDTVPDNYSGFCAWLASFLHKWTKIQRSFWRKVYRQHDNFAEAGAQIRPSVDRSIDPSAEQGFVLRWREEPMARWPDHLGFPLCASKQKGLAINSENRTKIYLVEIKTVS